MSTTLQADRDFLLDVLRRGPVLQTLQTTDRDREELARRLDISSATCYRYTNWLDERGMLEDADEVVSLTPLGETIAAELTSFDDAIRRYLEVGDGDWEVLAEVTKLAPGLHALSHRSLDRRDLEERIGVSKTTGYRLTRSLEKRGLVERVESAYALTTDGSAILNAVGSSTFSSSCRSSLRSRFRSRASASVA